MIGSRETPKRICDQLEGLANAYSSVGWVGRSGGADGADTCLEASTPEHMEIYLPWAGFNGREADGKVYINTDPLVNRREAWSIASELHPAWEKCSRGAQALHRRNVYQILGKDLTSPSECVICYAVPVGKEGYVKGGTATAVKLAIEKGIPVFNLYNKDAVDKALEFLHEH